MTNKGLDAGRCLAYTPYVTPGTMTIDNAIRLFNALVSSWHAFQVLRDAGYIRFRDRRWRPTIEGVAAGIHSHVNLEHL